MSPAAESPQAAYLRGPLSELSQHLGPVVGNDTQGVVQQSHVLQTREAADASDLFHLKGIPRVSSLTTWQRDNMSNGQQKPPILTEATNVEAQPPQKPVSLLGRGSPVRFCCR